MSIDKIKIAIGDYLWSFWQNNHDIKAITRAEKLLRHEIEIGLRRRYQDFEEHELLFKKLGIETNLKLKKKYEEIINGRILADAKNARGNKSQIRKI